jgi:PAS domain S-box-containing protein
MENYSFSLVNTAFLLMLDWTPEKAYEKTTKFEDILAPEIRESFIKEIETKFNQQIQHFETNTKIMKSNNELVSVEIHFTTIPNEEGGNSVLGIVHDIEKKLEQENQKLQSEKINLFTSIAVTTNDTINSPLMSIHGYVQMIEGHILKPTPSQERAFKTIYSSIDKIKVILSKLVEYTNQAKSSNLDDILKTKEYNFGGYAMLDLTKEKKEDE